MVTERKCHSACNIDPLTGGSASKIGSDAILVQFRLFCAD
jgi:hypothetical protein